MKNIKFGELLRTERKRNHLTQNELSVKTGLSGASIRRYESGQSFPQLGTLLILSEVFHNPDFVTQALDDAHCGYAKTVQPHTDTTSIQITLLNNILIHHPDIISSLITHATILSKMTTEGRDKVNDIITAFSYVPNYQQQKGD